MARATFRFGPGSVCFRAQSGLGSNILQTLTLSDRARIAIRLEPRESRWYLSLGQVYWSSEEYDLALSGLGVAWSSMTTISASGPLRPFGRSARLSDGD